MSAYFTDEVARSSVGANFPRPLYFFEPTSTPSTPSSIRVLREIRDSDYRCSLASFFTGVQAHVCRCPKAGVHTL